MSCIRLFTVLAIFGMWACGIGDMSVGPREGMVVYSERRVEVALGADATRRVLVAVSGALSSSTARSIGSSDDGQSHRMSREDLLALKARLESKLAAQRASNAASSCVVHDDAEFAITYTIVGIDDDSSHLLGYAATTATTQIEQSAYLQVESEYWWPDYDFGEARARAEGVAACDDALSVGIEIDYQHDPRLYAQAVFNAFGEVTHIIPGETDWTHDIQSYWHRGNDDGGEN